jgi:hypothetical protein
MERVTNLVLHPEGSYADWNPQVTCAHQCGSSAGVFIGLSVRERDSLCAR